MKRFTTWLWKEWRDQRAVTIGILIAIPVLTALAYWAFGEKLGVAAIGNVRTIFLGIAVGLVVFAIAGDLFAGENRRKTIHAVRRLPGSMRSAFLAKLAYLALLIVVVIALQGGSLAVAEYLNGPRMAKLGLATSYYNSSDVRSLALLEALVQFPSSTLWLTGLGFGVFALWTLLVSSWLGRSGVAGIGAIVLLAALATPFFLFFKEHPWFFPGPLRLASMTAAVAALVALVAVSFSFLWGQRYAGRALRPFLLGGSVLLLSLGGGYAYAHKSLEDWLDVRPTDKGFFIDQAQYGAGGKYLYLNVHRGSLWSVGRRLYGRSGTPRSAWSSRRGSPAQAWIVDLETGNRRIVDDRAERWIDRVSESQGLPPLRPLDPVEALACYRLGGEEGAGLAWWDARTSAEVRILPHNLRDATTLRLVRRQLRADAWLRDEEGKRLWMRDGVIEHEGMDLALPNGLVPRLARGVLRTIPGGWYGFRTTDDGKSFQWAVVDAASGAQQDISSLDQGQQVAPAAVLSPVHGFARKRRWVENGKQIDRIRLVRLLDPAHPFDVKNAPEDISSVVGRDLALALRGKKNDYSVHVWNPLTGEDHEPEWSGPPLVGISHCGAMGRTGDGRILLQFSSELPTRRAAWAVLDPTLTKLTSLGGWTSQIGHAIALLEDGSLVELVLQKQVIRRYPDGTTEVLFPRK